jgi:predicted metalloprotease
MKWRDARQSTNVDDRRGSGPARLGGGGLRLGLGGTVVLLVVGMLFGINPLEMLGLMSGAQQAAPMQQDDGVNTAPADEQGQFAAAILGETEDVWSQIFQASNVQYPPATLVLFDGAVQSACGGATSAVGPFYCPGDRNVYIDLNFFREMEGRLGGGGDFAQAYVIAHEVGHHVQTLIGVGGDRSEGAEGGMVRQELQADCFAGLWAHNAQARHNWLEAGDIEEALRTASAIGDDTLQRQSQGRVVPDSFTHGSAEQRVRWFRTGFESGDFKACDTFSASRL